MQLNIKEKSWLARIAAIALRSSQMAIVFGKKIHLHNTSKADFLRNDRWVRHEKVHLQQFQRYGFLRFTFLYIWESILHGYTNNKFEVEAREGEQGD